MVSSMATAFGFLLSALISSALGSFYSTGQASPERVTAEAVKRRDKGVHLKNPILSMKS